MKAKEETETRSTRGKNIVLCSDGTGNSMLRNRGSNVWKLYEAVDLTRHRHDQKLAEQVAFYDDGVGTEDNKVLKVAGGAFGLGLSRNVRDLYEALCRSYRPGDQVYVFGFSRGGVHRPDAGRADRDLRGDQGRGAAHRPRVEGARQGGLRQVPQALQQPGNGRRSTS